MLQLNLRKRPEKKERQLPLLLDTGDRYLSTPLFQD